MSIFKFFLKTFLIIAIISPLFNAKIYALNLINSDYDKDKWFVEQIIFDTPKEVPENWLPLRVSSEYLPIDVNWDNDKREIIVYSHDLPWTNKSLCIRRYRADNLPVEMMIIDGVTYCSPRLISSFLEQRGFLYEDKVYYFNKELKKSKLINSGNSYLFKEKVLPKLTLTTDTLVEN